MYYTFLLPWLRLLCRPNINKCMQTIYDEKRCFTTTDSCMYVYPHSKRILDNPSYALLSQRAIKLSSPSTQLEMNLHYWWIKGLVAFNIKGRRRPFFFGWLMVFSAWFFLYSNKKSWSIFQVCCKGSSIRNVIICLNAHPLLVASRHQKPSRVQFARYNFVFEHNKSSFWAGLWGFNSKSNQR